MGYWCLFEVSLKWAFSCLVSMRVPIIWTHRRFLRFEFLLNISYLASTTRRRTLLTYLLPLVSCNVLVNRLNGNVVAGIRFRSLGNHGSMKLGKRRRNGCDAGAGAGAHRVSFLLLCSSSLFVAAFCMDSTRSRNIQTTIQLIMHRYYGVASFRHVYHPQKDNKASTTWLSRAMTVAAWEGKNTRGEWFSIILKTYKQRLLLYSFFADFSVTANFRPWIFLCTKAPMHRWRREWICQRWYKKRWRRNKDALPNSYTPMQTLPQNMKSMALA